MSKHTWECTGAQWGEELLWESSSINNSVWSIILAWLGGWWWAEGGRGTSRDTVMNEEIREREEEAEPGISRVLFMLGFVAFSQAVVMNSLDPERFLQSKHNFLSRVYLTFAFYSFKETSWGLRTFKANFICELFEKRLLFFLNYNLQCFVQQGCKNRSSLHTCTYTRDRNQCVIIALVFLFVYFRKHLLAFILNCSSKSAARIFALSRPLLSGWVSCYESTSPPRKPMPYSQSAISVSWANYFTGGFSQGCMSPCLSAAIDKALFTINMPLRFVIRRAAGVFVTVQL